MNIIGYIILGTIVGLLIYTYISSKKYDKTAEFQKKELAASLRVTEIIASLDSKKYSSEQIEKCINLMNSSLTAVIKEQYLKKILGIEA